MISSRPKVSIVMPTYNVEKYFRECIESVINQTLKEIEIIPVDDGSPDNCGKIMDEYASKDNRIKPIHKKNGGYGSAVNTGIEVASGEYIGIVETDDWIEPNMYEILYNNAKENNTDVTKCNFYKYNSKLKGLAKNKVWKQPKNALMNAPKNLFSLKDYKEVLILHASVWAGIYRADFIKQIKFIESGYYQDFPFFVEVLCRAKNISIVKKPLVHYRMEEGQNSSTLLKDKRLLNMARMSMKAKEILREYNLFDELKEELYYHIFLANYGFYNNIDKKYKAEYFILLKSLFSDIKSESDYKYFDSKQKEFVEYIIKTPYNIFVLSSIYKKIKNFIFSKYDYKIYRVYKFFNLIKITVKPVRMQVINSEIKKLRIANKKLNRKIDYLIDLLGRKENDIK